MLALPNGALVNDVDRGAALRGAESLRLHRGRLFLPASVSSSMQSSVSSDVGAPTICLFAYLVGAKPGQLSP